MSMSTTPTVEVEVEEDGSISKSAAVLACGAMAVFYVAVLYAPTGLLRMSTPVSRDHYFIRRFVCAALSTALSVAATFYLLTLGELQGLSAMLRVFGLRTDHLCQSVLIPLSLTSLIYLGSFFCKLHAHNISHNGLIPSVKQLPQGLARCARNVMAWRNYFVAPITEEVVFRACMIPLLLCAGFSTTLIIFLCPMFFSLAHLNHFIELYYQGRHSFSRALLVVGFQLCYTVVFGWYAAFLFIRTGTLIAPIVAHIFCNYMGLPTFHASHMRGLETIAFLAGVVGFFTLLFPATRPNLYNHRITGCNCWQAYCILYR
ncbi:CAAX prenyl protease 2 [Rhynchospora pubera]|uniref:intramembrane prenyl-peptidase Rce1 n=1 Tax=Rhynchospora pubera TaxID=906938 RepID=A0AAV8C1E3_9POAL|nr:CAAX prenyl protease 2 [Rhynchospora pubera]